MNIKVFDPKEASMPDTEQDAFDGEEFYIAMQRYRLARIDDQREVVACFEHVKRLARALQESGKGEPLSEDTISKLVHNRPDMAQALFHDLIPMGAFIELARSIEAAHGIHPAAIDRAMSEKGKP